MIKQAYFLFFLLLPIVFLHGQEADTHSIKGIVTDERNGEKLAAASVFLYQAGQLVSGQSTDLDGQFNFTDLSSGSYDLEVSYLSYQTQRFPGIELTENRRSIDFTVELGPDYFYFNTLTVRASHTPSLLARSLDAYEFNRQAAVFNDPARLAALEVGVSQTNDQANHLVVRGNSPNKNLWRLNGLAIVNPSHTSNAGTNLDGPTLSGGGVNALSPQLIRSGRLYTEGTPARYGSGLGSTFALEMRPGGSLDRSYQAQASFIGIDLTAEGPIDSSNTYSWTYLATYRYSFTGLLADLGADFGGETIRFQDAGFHLHKWTREGGSISLFGLYGNSSNLFAAPTEIADRTEEKDLTDIDFESDLVIGSARWQQPIGIDHLLTFGAAYSSIAPSRIQRGIDNDSLNRGLRFGHDRLNIQANLNLGDDWEFGFDYLKDWMSNQVSGQLGEFSQLHEVEIDRLAAHLSFRKRFNRWKIWGGLESGVYAMDFSRLFWAPRLQVQYELRPGTITVNYEMRNHYPLENFVTPAASRILTDRRVNNNQLSLRYNFQTGNHNWQLGAFGQFTPKEEVRAINGFYLSANNSQEIDPYLEWRLFRGASRRYGVEMEWSYNRLHRPLFLKANSSFFRAETQQAGNTWSPDRFSYGWTGQLTMGNEWQGQTKKGIDRSRGFSLALIARGGERMPFIPDNPNNLPAGGSLGEPYYGFGGFVEQLPVYFRPDLRLYRTVDRPKTRITLSLDIQNVAGIRNVGSRYYDDFTGQIEEREQLGLIPVLSYRIEWR